MRVQRWIVGMLLGHCVAGKRDWRQVSEKAEDFEGGGDGCWDRNGDGCGDQNGDGIRVLKSTSLWESFVGNDGICTWCPWLVTMCWPGDWGILRRDVKRAEDDIWMIQRRWKRTVLLYWLIERTFVLRHFVSSIKITFSLKGLHKPKLPLGVVGISIITWLTILIPLSFQLLQSIILGFSATLGLSCFTAVEITTYEIFSIYCNQYAP